MIGPFPTPGYGRRTLSDVLPAVAAHLGVVVPALVNDQRTPDPLGLGSLLGEARKICLLLVDGLGDRLLVAAAADAPFLAAARATGPTLNAGFPSTTGTSITSLGVGQAPAMHGLLGCRTRIPGTSRLLNVLRWDTDVDPLGWQPLPTVLSTLEAAGIPAEVVQPALFRDSGLTRAGLRGGRHRPAETAGDLIAQVVASLSAASAALTIAYYSDLDRIGHLRGCGSAAWRHQIAVVDLLVQRLAAALPPAAVLLVTGDHGMVDVGTEEWAGAGAQGGRLDVERTEHLLDGVTLLGGEARARHLYVQDGALADVLQTWRAVLRDGAWIATGEEALADGWFGPSVRDEVRPRVGDVVVAAAGNTALVAPVGEPRESALIGMHGSATPEEMDVPLIVVHHDGGSVSAGGGSGP